MYAWEGIFHSLCPSSSAVTTAVAPPPLHSLTVRVKGLLPQTPAPVHRNSSLLGRDTSPPPPLGYLPDLQLAKRVCSLDLIIGAHSRSFLYTGTEAASAESTALTTVY